MQNQPYRQSENNNRQAQIIARQKIIKQNQDIEQGLIKQKMINLDKPVHSFLLRQVQACFAENMAMEKPFAKKPKALASPVFFYGNRAIIRTTRQKAAISAQQGRNNRLVNFNQR